MAFFLLIFVLFVSSFVSLMRIENIYSQNLFCPKTTKEDQNRLSEIGERNVIRFSFNVNCIRSRWNKEMRTNGKNSIRKSFLSLYVSILDFCVDCEIFLWSTNGRMSWKKSVIIIFVFVSIVVAIEWIERRQTNVDVQVENCPFLVSFKSFCVVTKLSRVRMNKKPRKKIISKINCVDAILRFIVCWSYPFDSMRSPVTNSINGIKSGTIHVMFMFIFFFFFSFFSFVILVSLFFPFGKCHFSIYRKSSSDTHSEQMSKAQTTRTQNHFVCQPIIWLNAFSK